MTPLANIIYATDDAEKPSSPTWDTKRAHQQLFILPPDILLRVDIMEEARTFEAMQEMGLDRSPYAEFSIKYLHHGLSPAIAGQLAEILIYFRNVVRNDGVPTIEIAISYYRVLPNGSNMMKALSTMPKAVHQGIVGFAQAIYRTLLVLLATRNVEKIKSTRKLPKSMGKHAIQTVTTIRIGRITETEYEKGEPSGRVMRAHLRRGHIRKQHHGPGNAYEKKIWIAPVFVNSDREYVPREAYNVSFPLDSSPTRH